MTKKKILLIGIMFISIFVLAACGGSNNNEETGEKGSEELEQEETEGLEALDIEDLDADDAMLIINGEEITRGEFDDQFDRTKQMVSQQYGVDLDSEENAMMIPELQHQTVENLIGQRVLKQTAESKGLEVTEEQIDQNIGMLVEQFGGEEGFQEALEVDDLTEEDLEKLVYEELLISQLFEAELNLEDFEITDKEIETFYAQYQMSMEQQGEEVPPLEEVKDQITQQLQQQKSQEEQQNYITELVDDSDIERLY